MRQHFAGFVERIYTNVCRDEAVARRYFPPALRVSLLTLFDRWSTGVTNGPAEGHDTNVEYAAAKGASAQDVRADTEDRMLWS